MKTEVEEDGRGAIDSPQRNAEAQSTRYNKGDPQNPKLIQRL